jgi:hypothetical protein
LERAVGEMRVASGLLFIIITKGYDTDKNIIL